MSDTALSYLGAPTMGLPVDAAGRLIEEFRSPLGQFLGAAAGENFWATIAGQVRADDRVRLAERTAPEPELAPMPEDEWRSSEHFREGVPYRRGMTRAAARVLADVSDEQRERERILGSRHDWGSAALAFGAGIVGSLPTPENFLPFAGPALEAARAGYLGRRFAQFAASAEAARTGGAGARAAFGAGAGAMDATLGTAIAMPMVNAGRASFGDDVTWSEIALDLALGFAAGGVLGGAIGAAIPARRAGAPAGASGAETPLAALPPVPAQDAALHAMTAGAVQLAEGGHIDLSLTPPAVRQQLEGLLAENRRLQAMVLPTAEDGAGVSARTAARVPVGAAAARPGAEGRASTPAGTEVSFRYEVVEAADLVPSHDPLSFAENPAFPQELQPRDRNLPERQQQVRDMAARLRPEELEASASTTTGAPLIGPDGLVESGNGRTMAIVNAYAQGLPTAQAYRASLVRAGFDQAATMQRPVLVRRRTSELTPDARRRYVEESNVAQIDRATAAEQARTDARRVTLPMLQMLRSPDLAAAGNGDFVRAFIGQLPAGEARDLSTKGELTPDGLARIQRALAARAYQNHQLIQRLTQSREGAAEAMGRALIDAAPAIAHLRAAVEAGQVRAGLDATDALVRAVRRINDARDAGKPLRSVLDQLDIFGDDASPAERAFLELLLRHPIRQEIGGLGRETIAARLEAYARHALEAPQTPDAFGMPPPGLGDVLRAAFREAGLDPPAALRGLDADTYTPPAAPPPEPLAPMRSADPVAAAAERMGLDIEGAAHLAEANRLAERGDLPDDLRAMLDETAELRAKVEHADESWQAAAACVIRG